MDMRRAEQLSWQAIVIIILVILSIIFGIILVQQFTDIGMNALDFDFL